MNSVLSNAIKLAPDVILTFVPKDVYKNFSLKAQFSEKSYIPFTILKWFYFFYSMWINIICVLIPCCLWHQYV